MRLKVPLDGLRRLNFAGRHRGKFDQERDERRFFYDEFDCSADEHRAGFY